MINARKRPASKTFLFHPLLFTKAFPEFSLPPVGGGGFSAPEPKPAGKVELIAKTQIIADLPDRPVG